MALHIKSGYNISLPTSYNLGNYTTEPKLPISFSGVIATSNSKPMPITSISIQPYLSLTTNQSISKGDLVIVLFAKDNALQEDFSGPNDGIVYFLSGSEPVDNFTPISIPSFANNVQDLAVINSFLTFTAVAALTEPVVGTGFFISEKDYPSNSTLIVQSLSDILESPFAGACSILLFKNYSNYYDNLIRPLKNTLATFALENNIISHEQTWPGPGFIEKGYNYTVSNISRTATSTFNRPNNKKLFLRVVASEGPSGDTFSPTAGWTAIPVVGTTGGSGTSNISIWAEFLISNNSSVTSNPTVPATSKMVQFFEIISDSDVTYIY